MITCVDMQAIITARLEDADVLCSNDRHDGAVYLAGYAVEIALKRRFCRDHEELCFPESKAEFKRWEEKYGVWLATHALQRLADVTGWDETELWTEWSLVSTWTETLRYARVGYAGRERAPQLLDAARVIVGAL